MNSLTQKRYLEASDLDLIRKSADWQAVFTGLGLQKCEKKSKDHDWWAYSPFHEERTPSFHMAQGGIWYDFSVSEGGGVIELIQKLKALNCYEAAEYLVEQGWAWLDQPVTGDVTENVTASVTRCDVHHNPSQPVTSKQNEVQATCQIEHNAPIRQDLIPMCHYDAALAARGISEGSCEALGIGLLQQGRSPMRGRIIFQIADARLSDDGRLQRVILSHMGRRVDGEEPNESIDESPDQPKYRFYEGFHKSAELYGQEVLWLDEKAKAQIEETGYITLTEGPFDVAKAYEAGLRNVVGAFGADISKTQAHKLKRLCTYFGVDQIIIAFDRDKAGQKGQIKARERLKELGLKSRHFDWEGSLGQSREGVIHIPDHIGDLAEFNPEQMNWLRKKRLL